MRFYTQQHQHYCGIDLHARQHVPLHPGPPIALTKKSLKVSISITDQWFCFIALPTRAVRLRPPGAGVELGRSRVRYNALRSANAGS